MFVKNIGVEKLILVCLFILLLVFVVAMGAFADVNPQDDLKRLMTRYSRVLIRISPALLVVVLGITALLTREWTDDGQEHSSGARMSTDTWRPFRSYAPEIEQSLNILSRFQLQQVEYIRTRGVPIVMESTQAWNEYHHGLIALTDESTGLIHLNMLKINTPVLMAGAIGHEIRHVQYGDPRYSLHRPGTVVRMLWTEEIDVHTRTLILLWKLHPMDPKSVPTSLLVSEFLLWTLLPLIRFSSALFCIVGAIFTVRLFRLSRLRVSMSSE